MTDSAITVSDARSFGGYKPDPDVDLNQAVLRRIDGLIAALASVGENAVRVPYAWITEAVKLNLNQRGFRVLPEMGTGDDTMGVSWEPWENPPEVIKDLLGVVQANIWDLLPEPVRDVVNLLLAGDTSYVCLYNKVKAHDPGLTHWQPDLLYHTPKAQKAEHMRLSAQGWANLAVRAAIARDVWEGCCGPGFIEAVKEALCRQRLSQGMSRPHSLVLPDGKESDWGWREETPALPAPAQEPSAQESQP
jgi:hypothetical protein